MIWYFLLMKEKQKEFALNKEFFLCEFDFYTISTLIFTWIFYVIWEACMYV